MTRTNEYIVKIIILIICFILLSACKDITVTTIIFPDGSCERSIIVESQSEKIFNDVFPIPMDDSWVMDKKVSSKRSSSPEEHRFTYTARKKFKTIAELNLEFTDQESENVFLLRPRIEFQKHWKGFFTTFIYHETYPILPLFKRIPADRYFSSEEMKLIELNIKNQGELEADIPNDEMKAFNNKFFNWYYGCIFEEFFHILQQKVKALKSDSLTLEKIISGKKELYTALINQMESITDTEISIKKVFKVGEKLFNTPDIWKLWEQNRETFEEYERGMKKIGDAMVNQYTNNVVMPGIITRTNAQTVIGNSVSWEIAPPYLFLRDYKMIVESRLVNWWLVGFTLVIFVVILAAILLGNLLRK